MKVINIEIKARIENPDFIRKILKKHHADFRGIDYQTDTYFDVPSGRLKLREGNIENTLIFYHRPDQQGPKQSDCLLYYPADPLSLKNILLNSLEVLVIVNKTREIYFIGNVKFHIDRIKGLGDFLEIEAAGNNGTKLVGELHSQCNKYMDIFGILPDNLVELSYSDMLINFKKR